MLLFLADEGHDVGLLIGVEPVDGIVALEPCHLLLGIDACVFLDACHSLLESHLSVEVGKELLVSHGVQRILVSVG